MRGSLAGSAVLLPAPAEPPQSQPGCWETGSAAALSKRSETWTESPVKSRGFLVLLLLKAAELC